MRSNSWRQSGGSSDMSCGSIRVSKASALTPRAKTRPSSFQRPGGRGEGGALWGFQIQGWMIGTKNNGKMASMESGGECHGGKGEGHEEHKEAGTSGTSTRQKRKRRSEHNDRAGGDLEAQPGGLGEEETKNKRMNIESASAQTGGTARKTIKVVCGSHQDLKVVICGSHQAQVGTEKNNQTI